MGRTGQRLLAMVLLCGLLVVGSSGFTAATVSRSAGIAVAEDDRAYLSYETACDGDAPVATLTNRYESTELRVTVVANGTTRTVSVAPLTDRSLRLDDATQGDSITVRATNPTGGLAIQYTRQIERACPAIGG